MISGARRSHAPLIIHFITPILWVRNIMAKIERRLPHNVSGDFYVDSSCYAEA
jgi:hypothetical protein